MVGSFAPTVPFLTPSEPCDRGAAGSLLATRNRERAGRAARRPLARRDWRALLALAATITAVALAGVASASSSATLGLLALRCAAMAAWAVAARYRPGVVLVVALPAHAIPRLRGGVLHTGARPLHELAVPLFLKGRVVIGGHQPEAFRTSEASPSLRTPAPPGA